MDAYRTFVAVAPHVGICRARPVEVRSSRWEGLECDLSILRRCGSCGGVYGAATPHVVARAARGGLGCNDGWCAFVLGICFELHVR